MTYRRYREGSVVLKQDKPVKSFYVILGGTVSVHYQDSDVVEVKENREVRRKSSLVSEYTKQPRYLTLHPTRLPHTSFPHIDKVLPHT